MKKLFLFALALAMTANVLAQFNPQTTPLTLEARDANTQVKVLNKSLGAFEYQINGQGTKQSIAADAEVTIDLPNVGDYVQLWGNQATTCPANSASHIGVPSGFAYVYGNAMSLVQFNSPTFDNLTRLQASGAFYQLFYQVTSLDIHPTKDLVLPATILANSCYSQMFYGCTGLTKVPALPATTLAESCYDYMFWGCTGLTQPQDTLPAMRLKPSCYRGMFNNCTGLTKAPKLPATTLAEYCYFYMFYNCAALTQVQDTLPAMIMEPYCYKDMFDGCSSLTQAPVLPAKTLANQCYYSMFSYCTNLAQAPVLPATTLSPSCYEYMFYGCSSLNKVECYAITFADNSTYRWLGRVAATGTFVKATAASDWTLDSRDGIPANWTVQEIDVDEPATPVISLTSASIIDTAYISLSCTTAGASIYYTTDGSAPSATNGTLYTTPIFVDVTAANENSSMAIIAVAIKNGESSALTTRNYELSRTNCQLIASIQSGQGSYSVPAYAKYGDEVTVEVTPGHGCTLDYIAVNQIGRLEGNTFVVPAHHDYLNVYIYLRQVYAITWKNFNDTVLAVTNVDMGYAPEYPYGTPHRDDEEGWEYTFSGWSPTLVQVTEDATYTAQYTATKKKYHVTFVDFDDRVIKEEDVFYQEAATAPADPTREGYTFAGWDQSFSSITSAITVKATYTINMYSVTVIAENGSIVAKDAAENVVDLSEKVAYGTVLYLTATPDEGYELDSWTNYNPETGLTVVDNVTVTANFNLQTFQVTFVDWDDTVLKAAQTVNYGEAAVAPADPQREGYKFTGWDKDFSAVKEDMTVKAQYEELSEGIEAVFTGENAAKILRNGQIYILRGDKTYTLQGQEME